MNGITKTIMVVLGIALLFGAVSAAGGAQVVKLVQKDPATWEKIPAGAHGVFKIGAFEKAFTFNAQGLEKNTEYTLLSYAEPYPGTGSKVLGTATSNKKGKLNINGKFSDIESLVYNVYSASAPGDYQNTVGAKIWLVRTSDLSITSGTASFTAWNPTLYLFEKSLIDYPDLNGLKLVQKDPSTWEPIVGGQGTFASSKSGYVFTASKLTPSTSYTLISYNEVWGSVNGVLGKGTSGKKGNLVISGSSFTGSLIYNTYTSGEYAGFTGAKIWLVPTSGISGGVLTSWNPSAYLFETHLILN